MFQRGATAPNRPVLSVLFTLRLLNWLGVRHPQIHYLQSTPLLGMFNPCIALPLGPGSCVIGINRNDHITRRRRADCERPGGRVVYVYTVN